MNYLITLMFDGTKYHGWQRQKNALSVQEVVENAVTSLVGEKCTVCGCSHTDTGVHANEFAANFIVQKQLSPKSVVSGLNFFLPDDIAVKDCTEVPPDFNARFSCKSKEYIYKIYNSELRNPFYVNRALFYRYRLDEAFLDRQAQAFVGMHDFSAVRAEGSTVKTTVRTVLHAGVERYGDEVLFRFEADGFLYNMVRIMSGTLIYISEGKIPADSVADIIQSKNRLRAGKTLPPEGLYLNRVRF